MIYLVIGIVVVVVAGALLSQRARNAAGTSEGQRSDSPAPEESGFDEALRKAETEGAAADSLSLSRADTATGPPTTVPSAVAPTAAPVPTPGEETEWGVTEEVTPLKPVLAAAPISSPSALSSATYSSAAPPVLSGDSPYAFGNTQEEKPKPEAKLLRWSGKTGSIQVGELSIRGPVAYWSEGASSTPEPSCIDIALPVDTSGEETPPDEETASYAGMTPAQRGAYLLWLAGGRIQPPAYACYPTLWLFGVERRALSDRLDASICIGEAFRLIPLIHWESLRTWLIRFITWMAAKAWLPEEQLLAFSRSLSVIPKEILCMLLRPYADAKLPLPSVIAFTLMRSSPFPAEDGTAKKTVPHSDELVEKFAAVYKSKCSGGVVLTKPKSSLFVAYVPSNPSLARDKNASGGVLELPDFFKDIADFAPLIAAWDVFLPTILPGEPAPPTAAEEVKKRPDWEAFVRDALKLPEGDGEPVDFQLLKPIFTNLGVLGNLMGIERPPEDQSEETKDDKDAREARKTKAADRKKISDAAKVEGFLVLPDLGVAGKDYLWDAPVALTPLPAGSRLSQDCSAAALMLEYSAALTGLFDPEALEGMRKRLDDYFPLSPDDRGRLEALSAVLASSPEGAGRGPENIGECLQFWLNREGRGVVRDFLTSFLANFSAASGGMREEREWAQKVRESLGVEENDPPPVSFGDEKPLPELGAAAGKILAPLFKD